MDFKCLHWREKTAQSFDKENIFIEKAGVKYNIYDKIQEAREDTEVIPTLEKYGCIDKLMLNVPDVYADFQNMNNLRNIKEQEIKANNMWDNLPLETRSQFNNDKYNFLQNGEKWLAKKLKEMTPKEPVQTEMFENKESEAQNG